jgi:hypothetical protein
MNKNLISKIALGLLVISLPMLTTGCKKDKLEDSLESDLLLEEENDLIEDLFDSTFESEEIDDSETEDFTAVEEDYTEEDSSINNTQTNETSASAKTVTGEFYGFADTSSVEVKINGEYRVLKVAGSVIDILEEKSIGESITFSYVDNGSYGGQMTSVK